MSRAPAVGALRAGACDPDAAWRGRAAQSGRAAPASSLSTRAVLALAAANVRYWPTVAPVVREQLRHWRARAATIADPRLRSLALAKLAGEGLNAEVAAMLATLAPRAHRRPVVKAIVALEVLYDFLDGLTETPASEAAGDGALLFRAFTEALSPSTERTPDYYRLRAAGDGGYLQELVATVRFVLAGLPATVKVAEVLRENATRGAQAQLAIHAAQAHGDGPLERWAIRHAAGSRLQWREYLAGAACSVLSAHALIVAAADREMTLAQARALEEIYLSISVLPTLLDSALDHELDEREGHLGYARLYSGPDELATRLEAVIADVIDVSARAPKGAHHLMTLVGVVAYYTTAPAARSEFARPIAERLQAQLRPLIVPTLALMRAWRAGTDARGPSRVTDGTSGASR
jgi:tetraprenyl-beta-curcumene synthase